MSRYIDADKLDKEFNEILDNPEEYDKPIHDMLREFYSAPTVDVEPVRHGHWEQDGHHIRCSECGTYFCRLDREGNSFPREYCPCCGVKMDGEEDDFDYWEESGAADAYADHQR